jgi:hypothetical protein
MREKEKLDGDEGELDPGTLVGAGSGRRRSNLAGSGAWLYIRYLTLLLDGARD